MTQRPISSSYCPVGVILPPRTKTFVSRWSFARQTRFPTVQKCPFQPGDLHAPAGTGPQVQVFTVPSRRGPTPSISKLFQLWNSLETGGGTKMYASPNPCTPQRHYGGCRRRKDLIDLSPGKAPTRPVLKDRSWVNSPMGGYVRGRDCSHSQTALAKEPAAKSRKEVNDLTRTLKTRRGPKAPRQSLVPASTPTGKTATFERGTCNSGALGPVAKIPLPATTDATPVWKMPASPGVHSLGPVEGDFLPIQLRNSYENTRPAKMSLESNPCTSQRHRVRSLQHRGI